MKKLFPGDYHPGKPGLTKVLGSLESEIMEIIWRKDCEVCVRDVLEELSLQREIAYTTVMTIMGRLADKKLLQKRKMGNAFFFLPVMSRGEFTARIVSGVVDDLLADFSEAAMAHFIDRALRQDRFSVERLEKMLASLKEREGEDNVE